LKDAPKFQSIIIAFNGVSQGVNNKDETEVAKSTGVTHGTHVMGTKKSKRLVKEERILENISAAIKGTVNTSNSNKGASGVLAAAVEKFTIIIIASI
jgi:hypothetical protein